MATTTSTPQAILDAVGGAENITHLTHCATRLRFELKDASVVDKATVEKIPGVMGAVPQSGDRYQIIIGGAVQSVYNDIMKLPAMAGGASSSAKSDADIKAAARAKARGKNAYVDAFFEYLSDAFRPLLPVLLGASLILALIAVLEAFGVVDTHAKVLPSWLVFTNTMWRSVFYFLPAMVAYNAAKKLDIDPWVGAAVVLALLTPEYTSLKTLKETHCIKSSVGSDLCTTDIFGLPMKWSDYGGQVFLPLIMVPILALVYRGLKKVIPANVQMVFVPFFSFLVMIPVSAFLIGPFSLWLGNSIGSGLSWLNTTAPIVFAIFIPLLYPFLVPLGLHWPLNALQLANIAGPAHADFIQGPMGTWNFACFGATLGVLILTLRNGDKELRQTASGALAAGLFGGISEPSLYGIHLRFKRIYPLMLTGCAAGGLTIGVISWISGSPVLTGTFVFTSLLTIPVFHPTVTYAISIAVAFFVSAFMVVTFGYQGKEEKAAAAAEQQEAPKAEAAPAAAPAEAAPKAELVAGQEVVLTAPLNGTVVALEDVPDPVFSSGAVGKGAGIEPSDGASIKVVAPADGSVVVAPSSGHAYGLALDNGLEILIHVGIDTVNLAGQGFDVKVAKGDRVKAGQTLVVVDRAVIEEAGYKLVTPVLVTNYMNFAEVEVIASGDIETGADLVKATK